MAKSPSGSSNSIGSSRKAIRFNFDLNGSMVVHKVDDITKDHTKTILVGLKNIKPGEFYTHEQFFKSIGVVHPDITYASKSNPMFQKYRCRVRRNGNYIVAWCNPKDVKVLNGRNIDG